MWRLERWQYVSQCQFEKLLKTNLRIFKRPIWEAKLSLVPISRHQAPSASHEARDHLKKWHLRRLRGREGNPGNLEKAAGISPRWHPATWKWPKPFQVMASSRHLLLPLLGMVGATYILSSGRIWMHVFVKSSSSYFQERVLRVWSLTRLLLLTCLCLEYAPSKAALLPSLQCSNVAHWTVKWNEEGACSVQYWRGCMEM